MHVLTLVGDRFSGKTALCELWSGHPATNAYLTTMHITPYQFSQLIIYDTPSMERFLEDVEEWYAVSDVIILMVSIDQYTDSWYLRISERYPELEWILILNGDNQFQLRRLWALENDIRVFQLNTGSVKNVHETLANITDYLEDIPMRLTKEGYFWNYWPVEAFYSIYTRIISSIFGNSSSGAMGSK